MDWVATPDYKTQEYHRSLR